MITALISRVSRSLRAQVGKGSSLPTPSILIRSASPPEVVTVGPVSPQPSSMEAKSVPVRTIRALGWKNTGERESKGGRDTSSRCAALNSRDPRTAGKTHVIENFQTIWGRCANLQTMVILTHHEEADKPEDAPPLFHRGQDPEGGT
jgi:hypothetical protein